MNKKFVAAGMAAAMAATIYTEEMAQTTYYAKVAGVYQPMPEEAVKKMKELSTTLVRA